MQPTTINIQTYTHKATVSLATEYFVFSYNCVVADHNSLHYHTSYELEFLIDGEVDMMINSNKYHCRPGQCWIVMPNSFHQCINISEKATVISIKFTEKALTKEIFMSLKKNYPYFIKKLTQDELNYAKSKIDNLFIELGTINTEAFKFTLIKCILSQIIGRLFDSTNTDQTIDDTVFPRKFIESVDYIKNNFTEKLSRDDIAAKFGISPSYYSTLFKKYTNKSFSDFVLGERLNYAYYLLLTTDDSIGIIAENSGFDTFAYFSKAFKKAYGASPSKIKKHHF